MSETVLRILLSELQTVRIVCQCGAVMEMAVTALDRNQPSARNRDVNCPGCGATVRQGAEDQNHGPVSDPFDLLAEAWKRLNNPQLVYKVEFAVRTPEGAPSEFAGQRRRQVPETNSEVW
jgi:hypothetical protein